MSAGRPLYDLVLSERDYPEWNGPPSRSLVICTSPRSGSSLLGEALYFAKGLGSPLEYFHAGFRPGFEERWQTTGFAHYLSVLHRRRTDPSGVFSVKLFWPDVMAVARELAPQSLAADGPAFLDGPAYRRIFALLGEVIPNPQFVFLCRRDQIRQAMSACRASRSGLWRRFDESPEQRPAYDFRGVLRYLIALQRQNENWKRFFQANRLGPLDISYEDLSADYDKAVRSLLQELGRSDVSISPPRLRRQSDDETEQLVQRFRAKFHALAVGGDEGRAPDDLLCDGAAR